MSEASRMLARRQASLPWGLVGQFAWALVLALPLLWRLGAPPLFDVDEGAFSEATREMLASHDWWHTTLNGEPRFDKPIGVYWLQALSVHLFGLREWALRLPSALSMWGMALVLQAFAARRWGGQVGMLAGLMAVTSLGVQAIGHGATADGLLNLLLCLAGLALWRFIESGDTAALRWTYAWVGLGLLVKGPVAVVVPGGAFVLWCVASRQWRMLRQAVLDWKGWVLLLAIALPWYVYALQRHGMAFVEGFILRHNVQRFSGTLEGHGGSPLYYLLVLPLLALPWTPVLVATVARARQLWREPLARYLLGWAGFVLAFFSLSGTKLPHYVLYGYAPLVLLMAAGLANAGPRLRRAVALAMVFWATCLALLPWGLLKYAHAIRDPLYRALVEGAPQPSPWPAVAALGVLIALLARRRGSPAWLAGSSLVPALLLTGWTLPWIGQALQGPVREAAAVALQHGGPVVQWQVHLPSFAVYLQQPVPKRDPRPEDMALTRADRIPPGDDGRARLFESRGVVLLGPLPPR